MDTRLRIRELRETQGMSQRKLAQRMGLNPSTIAHWELGYKTPTVENLIALAGIFGCSTDAVLGREPPVKPPQ